MVARPVLRTSVVLLSAATVLGAGGLALAVGSSAGAAAQRASATSSALVAARTTTRKTAPDTITISNFMYHPMKLTVKPGATITVTNKDTVTHTLTATQNQFNTGNIAPGHTKKFKAPEKKGTYHYICAIHQFMTGTIIVK